MRRSRSRKKGEEEGEEGMMGVNNGGPPPLTPPPVLVKEKMNLIPERNGEEDKSSSEETSMSSTAPTVPPNHLKEDDVPIEMDEDYRTCEMPPLPPNMETSAACPNSNNSCRMGCICDSIKSDPIVRTHCGKAKCFFECTCLTNKDDGDIRSRLRPRVSLLNWKYLENDKEKEPPPVNYRQLERGVTIYPRMRRVPVAPARFKNEYVMTSKLNGSAKDKRKGTALIRPQSGIRKASNLLKASAIHHRKTELGQTKILNATSKSRPSNVRVGDQKGGKSGSNSVKNPNQSPRTAKKKVQTPLDIPNVVRVVERDAFLVMVGYHKLCFVTFSVEATIPRAVVYEKAEATADDDEDLDYFPWLYLPFCSAGESWIFHVMETSEENEELEDDTTIFTHIPEINAIVPTRVLKNHLRMAQEQNKTVGLRMLWIGRDAKRRKGTIYMFPSLPNVLICGPFPHALIKSRFNAKFSRADKIAAMGHHVDGMLGMGDGIAPKAWKMFRKKEKQRVEEYLQEKAKLEEADKMTQYSVPEHVVISESCATPEGSFSTDTEFSMTSQNSPDELMDVEEEEDDLEGTGRKSLEESLVISWNDAAHLLKVQP